LTVHEQYKNPRPSEIKAKAKDLVSRARLKPRPQPSRPTWPRPRIYGMKPKSKATKFGLKAKDLHYWVKVNLPPNI